MASGKNIKTYFNGEWKDENTATIKAIISGSINYNPFRQ